MRKDKPMKYEIKHGNKTKQFRTLRQARDYAAFMLAYFQEAVVIKKIKQ